VKADILTPLVSGELLGGFAGDWVDWAQRITVRRLRDDVEHALALRETNAEAFREAGGLPPEARENREVGAPAIDRRGSVVAGGPLQSPTPPDREARPGPADRGTRAPAIGPREGSIPGSVPRITCSDDSEIRLNRHHEPLKSAPDEVCWARFFGPPDIVQLFKAVVCTVRRRIERDTGKLPTSGEALGAMLDHVLETWGEIDARVKARHKVFAGLHVDAEPARSPHPLPLGAGGERPGEPGQSVLIPSSARGSRGAAAAGGKGARRAALGAGDQARADASARLPLGGRQDQDQAVSDN
jgi:hypothetical protein